MVSLTRYFLWFLFICLIGTCLCGVIATLLPTSIAGVLTIVPYLFAMVFVLFKFLKQQRRAPSQTERVKITIGFSSIYWLYNIAFLVLGILIATRSNPDALRDFLLYLQNPIFLKIVGGMFLLIAVPLVLITYWFYGQQAQRMLNHMSAKK